MRRIRIFEHVSLDGVIQSPGAPDEDRDDGFRFGGWAAPRSDPAVGAAIVEAHSEPFDLLLGRRTYDIWSAYWPKATGNPFVETFNAATKFVATRRPESLTWGPAQSLGPDIVAGVQRLKGEPGPDLILWGSSTLAPVLLEHGLADEVMLLIYPVLLGAGKRIFTDAVPPRELNLVSTKAAQSGVVISIYKPSGALRTGSFGASEG